MKPFPAMDMDIDKLITRLMAHRYWDLLRMYREGNPFVKAFAHADDFRKNEFLLQVMMGFYPLSFAILQAFRQIEKLAPNDEVRKKAHFFVEVEEGKLAASDWYRGVPHSELYRRLFSSLAPVELHVHDQMLDQYLSALRLEQYGLIGALVTVAFIEKTGLDVLHLLHDFTAQWQVLTGRPTRKIDLTYLNEHLLHEGEGSADQHVNIIDQLIAQCKMKDVDSYPSIEIGILHFHDVTEMWFSRVFERALKISGLKSNLEDWAE